ncbi:MAG: sulfotransferase family 2 domain-containing protein [Planctomycetota bacterium]|nr:sulfotransferase family 2 domain-containing protein [Planctomycetota bacterium]
MYARIIRAIRSPRRTAKILRHLLLDDFIFIHINKSGGTSIERALSLAFEHRTALEKIEQIGRRRWDRRFTFAVVRNPWDRVVSQFHFRISENQTDLATNPIEFKEWVRRAYGEQDPAYLVPPKMFIPQLDWITDEDGTVLVDFVGRFENLKRDFEEVCRRLGKQVELPHLKATKRRPYQEYYDEETAELIRAWYQKDIDRFGYRFET